MDILINIVPNNIKYVIAQKVSSKNFLIFKTKSYYKITIGFNAGETANLKVYNEDDFNNLIGRINTIINYKLSAKD